MKKKSNYITPNGHKQLVTEHEQLTKVERPKTTQIIQWAASNGDRSENADYIYGKKRLREIDRRLRFLSNRLNDALIINPEDIKSDKVQFGACVEVVDEENKAKTYYIVGVDEIDTKNNLISWRSPIGSALIGKQVGDIVLIQTPQNEFEFEIISIQYKKIPYKE